MRKKDRQERWGNVEEEASETLKDTKKRGGVEKIETKNKERLNMQRFGQ